MRKIRKYDSEEKIKERFVKYRKGKKIRKDFLYKASKTKGQKNLKNRFKVIKWWSMILLLCRKHGSFEGNEIMIHLKEHGVTLNELLTKFHEDLVFTYG